VTIWLAAQGWLAAKARTSSAVMVMEMGDDGWLVDSMA
jgi:hypothetical protein